MKVKIFIKLLQNKKKYLSLQTQKGTGEFLMTKMVRQFSWLEYMPVTHGVAGSSPVRTAKEKALILQRVRVFLFYPDSIICILYIHRFYYKIRINRLISIAKYLLSYLGKCKSRSGFQDIFCVFFCSITMSVSLQSLF